jgi:hypothetical protein
VRLMLLAAGLAGALLVSAPRCAFAADNGAGSPLTPADAAGSWTLESGGRDLCVVRLGEEKAGDAGFAIQIPATCVGALPANIAGWAPTSHGMSLMGAGGQPLIGFSRWSNSLLVSHQASGLDIQLRRGGLNP